MKFLVTGGAGFIGGHLVRRLTADGHDVVVLDDLSSGKPEIVPATAKFIVGSILDEAAVAEAMADIDGCAHLAAIASVPKCNEDLVASHKVNITGFLNILDRARKSNSFPSIVYASSAAVYGSNQNVPLSEDEPAAPLSPYGADKYGCELHAKAAFQIYKLPSVGLRFFNVYGPGQDPSSPYSGVISRFAEQLSRGAPLVVHGDGAQSRDFVHVSDVVDGIARALAAPSQDASVYNICSGKETSVLSLAKQMIDCFGSEPSIEHVRRRDGDVMRSLGNPDRFHADYDFKPVVRLAEGLHSLAR